MHRIDWDLLFRYLGQECSPEERARVDEWLAADARHRAILESAMVAAGRVLEEVPVPSRTPRFATSRDTARSTSPWALAAAAALVLAVGGTLFSRAHQIPASADASAAVLRTAATTHGQRDTLRLQDGTRVILGAKSTLRYPMTFTGASRDVYLTGEGYFEVVHDTQHPFRVHAAGATAEDVGTAFGVRAYSGDASVQVVVAEGMVALGASNTPLQSATVLTHNQLGSLRNGGTITSVRHVDVDTYLGWLKGRLVFDEMPLSEVAVQLERWYGVNVRIADTAQASNKLTASFTDEPLADVLSALSPALDVRFERTGNTIVVYPARRSR